MTRPRRRRRVGHCPDVTMFKPAGIKARDMKEVILGFDELEALRLKDYLGLDQKVASKEMGISQPTFHRLLIVARKKVANALVNGRLLNIEGGDFKVNKNNKKFNRNCKCLECGYLLKKLKGIPCSNIPCPKCGSRMRRE